MSMIRIHAEAIDGSSSIYHEFLLRYARTKKSVYGFVEGLEDLSFYTGMVQSQLPPDWVFDVIVAGSKKKVIGCYGLFDWSRFDRRQIAFFVDRDVDHFVGRAQPRGYNIFITDDYSIECYLVSFDVLVRVIREIYGVASISVAEQQEVRESFRRHVALYRSVMKSVMAAVVCWRREGKDVVSEKIMPMRWFEWAGIGYRLKEEYQEVHARVGELAVELGFDAPSDADIAAVEREFRRRGGVRRVIRGKCLLEFFVKFAEKCHSDFECMFNATWGNPRNRVSLGPQNAMVVVGPRVRCPQRLQRFINRVFVRYTTAR